MKELDFLPRTYRQAIWRRQQNRRNVCYSVALAVALMGLHVANISRIRSAEATLAGLLADGSTWEVARAQVSGLQQRKELLQRQFALTNQIEDDAPLDAIIGEITQLLTESMAIRSITVQTASPDSKNEDGKNKGGQNKESEHKVTCVELFGIAATDVEVGMFMERVSSCPLFEDTKLSYCREPETAVRQTREFELKFATKRVAMGS